MGEPVDPAAGIKVTDIRRTRGWVALGLRDIWEYRELLWLLALRDIKVRYKQTVIGVGWAVLQPVATAVIFTVVFGRLARLPSDGVPYPVFALSGLVPWTFFATAVGSSGEQPGRQHEPDQQGVLPAAVRPDRGRRRGVRRSAGRHGGALRRDGAATACHGGWRMLLAVPFALLAFGAHWASGSGSRRSTSRYRDVRYVVPFLVQFWLFATPVAYAASLLPEAWRPFVALNPMVGVVEGFRGPCSAAVAIGAGSLSRRPCSTLVLLIAGAFYFRRMERSVADVL